MHALHVLAVLAVALFAKAEIYVTHPVSGATFVGGKPVTVVWIDDGAAPVLSDVGIVRVGLYTDGLKLVQSIVPVDVAKTHSFTFTPNPQAGPNSDQYYIAFVSTTGSYIGYSPNFGLTGMSGSFSSPDPAATSSIPIPSSLSSPTAIASTSTISASVPSTSGTATGTGATATGTSGASSGVSGTSTTIASGSSSASLSEGTSSTLQTTASGASSSGLSSVSKASTGSSSSTGTASSTVSTAVPTNAAVANGPATGFAWTLIAFLGFALL